MIFASRITVIVPLIEQNSGADLDDFLYSISRTANFHQLEILIFKNASVKLKREVIISYLSKYSNIVYIPLEKEETLGSILNIGIQLSNSDYLIKAHTGNRYGLYFFEMTAKELDTHKDIDVVYSGIVSTKQNSKNFYELYTDPTSVRLKLPYIDVQNLSTFMWRTSLHKEHGFFDETYRHLSDYAYWLSFPRACMRAINQPPERNDYWTLISEPQQKAVELIQKDEEYHKIRFRCS